MKRKVLPLLIIAVIGFIFPLSAQVKKGDILLGATMGFNTQNNSGSGAVSSSNANANLSPRIGFGVARNSVLGFRGNFGYQTYKPSGTNSKLTATTIGGGIYFRHFMPIRKQIGWYIEPSGDVAFRKDTNKDADGNKTKTTTTRYKASAVPGIYYQPMSKLLISVDFGGISFSHDRNKYAGAVRYSSSNIDFNLMSSFTFGVDFILGKS